MREIIRQIARQITQQVVRQIGLQAARQVGRIQQRCGCQGGRGGAAVVRQAAVVGCQAALGGGDGAAAGHGAAALAGRGVFGNFVQQKQFLERRGWQAVQGLGQLGGRCRVVDGPAHQGQHIVGGPEGFNLREQGHGTFEQVGAGRVVIFQAGRLDVEHRLQGASGGFKGLGAAELVEKLQQLQVGQGGGFGIFLDVVFQQDDGLIVFANGGVKLGLLLGVQKVLGGDRQVARRSLGAVALVQVVVRLGQEKSVGLDGHLDGGRGRRFCRGGRRAGLLSRSFWRFYGAVFYCFYAVLCFFFNGGCYVFFFSIGGVCAADGLVPIAGSVLAFGPQALQQVGNGQQRRCEHGQKQVKPQGQGVSRFGGCQFSRQPGDFGAAFFLLFF